MLLIIIQKIGNAQNVNQSKEILKIILFFANVIQYFVMIVIKYIKNKLIIFLKLKVINII